MTPDHLGTKLVPHRNEDFEHRRKWEHGKPSAAGDDASHIVEVRWSENTEARRHRLYLNQYLDLKVLHDGHRPASRPDVAAIPCLLIAHEGIAQTGNQFRRCGAVSHQVKVPGIDWKTVKRQRGASPDRPPPRPHDGEMSEGGAPPLVGLTHHDVGP